MRLIKDPVFSLNNIFLKKTERIDALMVVMTLCLMVYNVGQYKIREALKATDETVKNQVGKSLQNPTLRWLFQRINGQGNRIKIFVAVSASNHYPNLPFAA